TWLPKALARVAPNRECDAAACRRRDARSGRWWWECPAPPWRRRLWRGRADPRAAAGAARRLGNEGFEADHIEGRDEAPERLGYRVDFLAQPRKEGGLDMAPAGFHGVERIVGHAVDYESGQMQEQHYCLIPSCTVTFILLPELKHGT